LGFWGWVKDLRANAEPSIIIMLVGNKIDVCHENESYRQVLAEDGKKLANRYDLMFEEVSAVDGTNVKRVFEDLIHSKDKV